MNKISAEIIADSINEFGDRVTSFVLIFPRIVLAEFNTHRMLSRNSASSRAVPFNKMLERVETEPFIPMKWMKDHKGMQGNEYFEGDEVAAREAEWLMARNSAITSAKALSELGVTKQVVNRLLEPFMYHTVIATGTDWENFFALRAHEAAEIHIQDLAHKMLIEYNNSEPGLLQPSGLHIPFGDEIELTRMKKNIDEYNNDSGKKITEREALLMIGTARCARVSYFNYEGKDDYLADFKLHDNLSRMGHWSPFEHCCMAMEDSNRYGNFKGFKQYRQSFINENRSDDRVISQVEKEMLINHEQANQ